MTLQGGRGVGDITGEGEEQVTLQGGRGAGDITGRERCG